MIKTLQPDIVILDLRMPDGQTFDMRKLKADLGFTSRIVAISFAFDQDAQDLAVQLGADEMLDKIKLSAELIPAIKRAAQNHRIGP